ncbi:MAG TPA: DUF4962 domain-containing protein [Mycobacteriales bacterium]|nr:DUF4962 domain-containing protein [Mycobacteriales bacterium]
MASVSRRIALVLATVGAVIASVAVPLTPASAARDVNTPVLLSPANDPSTQLKDVILKWQPVAGASQYQVQVSPNGEWTNNAVTLPNNGDVVDPTFEMPVSLPNATYYWHVRAQVGGVWGRYSGQWTFVKDWVSPITILQQPSSADPTISWAPVKEASLYLVRYCPGACGTGTIGLQTGEVDCYTAETSVTPYTDGLVTATEPKSGPGAPKGCESATTFSLVQGLVYGWELIAYDDTTAASIAAEDAPGVQLDCEQGQQPLCDTVRYFGQAFQFEAPVAGNPARGATATGLKTTWHTSALPGSTCDVTATCPMTPTFSWNPVPGANYYLVDIYRDPNLTNEYQQYATSWPHFTPALTMFDAQAGQPYYWTVTPGTCEVSAADPSCAKPGETGTDTCPTAGGTSKPTLGTDAADIKATPPGPEGDQSMFGGSTATITLLGSGVLAPACVIPTDGFVDESTVDVGFGGLITFTYEAPAAANEEVTFKVVNPDGGTSNSSAPLTIVGGAQIFTGVTSDPVTFAKRSGPITLTSPANHAVISGTSPTFKWQDFMTSGALDSYDARNYELQVSQDHNFDSTVLDEKDVDLTQFTNPTTLLSDGSYYWRVAAIDEAGKVLTWSTIWQLTVNAVAPTVSFLSPAGAAVNQPLVIQLSTPLRDLNSQTLKVVPQGAPTANAIRGRIVEGASNTLYSFIPHTPLATGGTYQLRLTQTVLDTSGDPAVVSGSPIRVNQTALNTSAGWQYSRGWTRHSASSALSGSWVQAKAGSIATIQVAGSELVIYGCKAPHMGRLSINIAGQNFTASEFQTFTRCGEILWQGAIPGGIRTLTLRSASGIGNFDAIAVDPKPAGSTGPVSTTGSGGSPVSTTPTS